MSKGFGCSVSRRVRGNANFANTPHSSCECSLKLFESQTHKSYLRSTMSPDALVGLPTISIERTIAEEFDVTEIIQDFASAKARKAYFS